jgi:perosamine synthetase
MGDKYNSLLKNIPGIQLPLNLTDYANNIYWVYGIVLDESKNFDAKDTMSRLAEKGVGTRPFFWPMHEQPVFLKKGLFNGVECPVASNLARRGFYIPSGMALTDDQINFVAEKVREVLE